METALVMRNVAEIRRKEKASLGFNLEAAGHSQNWHDEICRQPYYSLSRITYCMGMATACRHPLLHGVCFDNAQCGGKTPESKGFPMLQLGSSWLPAEIGMT